MKYLIIGLILMISPQFAFAHNPLSAKFHLEAGEKVSLLTINLSQDGVNNTINSKYGEKYLSGITQNEYKKLLVDYIKENFNMSFDNQEILLNEGGVKLGNHQTDFKFVLPPLDAKTKQLEIHIPAFKENDNHQTIFSYKTKLKSEYKILSSKNDYKSTIDLLTPRKSNWQSIITISLLSLVVLAFLLFGSRMKRNKFS